MFYRRRNSFYVRYIVSWQVNASIGKRWGTRRCVLRAHHRCMWYTKGEEGGRMSERVREQERKDA